MAEEAPAARPPKQATTDTRFKWAAIVVGGLTLIAFLTHVASAHLANPPSDAVKNLIENCVKIYLMGFGAFLGLVGGKEL